MSKDPRVYLAHILECIGKIERFTVTGKTRFLADDMVQDAVLLSRMCAKVRTVLFLPRRVLLTTVVSDRRDFPDYGRDGPRRSAAIAGRTRHG